MMHKKWLILFIFVFSLISCQSGEPETDNQENMKQERMQKETTESTEETAETIPEQSKQKDRKEGNLTLHYMDAGQGDATLIQYQGTDDSYNLLYDTGDWLGSEVVPYLKQENIDKLDIVIISHPHADHIGQLKGVLQNFPVDEVWMPGNIASSAVFTEAMEAVSDSGVAYEEPRAGDTYDVGPMELTVLHPNHLTGDLNADSLSIHFRFGNTAFLFTGDAYKDGEREMIDTGLPIRANVLQLGHHGSNTSSSEIFIEAVQPEVGIYSAGIDNSYGHPHEEVVSLFEKKGIPLYGTDQYGTMIVTSDGEKVNLEPTKEEPVATPEQPEVETKEDTTNTETACIDINNASEAELTEIIHIGESRASKLVQMRPYDSVDDLVKINGIGAKRLADIKSENKACTKGE